MGEIQRQIAPVKLFFGLLDTDPAALQLALMRIELDFGAIDRRSPELPFSQTRYYCAEMGEPIRRQWISVAPLIAPGDLARTKVYTNRIEEWLCRRGDPANRKRRVNIDPGYLDLSKLVLASTKDFSHRIFLQDGVYAELTLQWKRQAGFQAAGEWTYPDYLTPEALKFFNELREHYKAEQRA